MKAQQHTRCSSSLFVGLALGSPPSPSATLLMWCARRWISWWVWEYARRQSFVSIKMEKYRTIRSTIRTIWREEGLKGFDRDTDVGMFRLLNSMISIPFFNSIFFPLNYEAMFVRVGDGENNASDARCRALVAGFVSNTLTNPIWGWWLGFKSWELGTWSRCSTLPHSRWES